MASSAVARDAVLALRRQIAAIEGRPTERLEPAPAHASRGLSDAGSDAGPIATGAAAFDERLDGGVPRAALTELLAPLPRDAGAAAGFALALAALAAPQEPSFGAPPLLWIAAGDAATENGRPCPQGLAAFGLAPRRLLYVSVGRLADALWVAEEAAGLAALGAVLFELRGAPKGLDLTATRRLHRRAVAAGRPVVLIRHGALPVPTAAPLRLLVAAAPAAPRLTPAGPLAGSIGEPAFLVDISRSRAARSGRFLLEWSHHDRRFRPADPAHRRPVVSAPADRPHPAAEAGAVLAFPAAAGGLPAAAGRSPRGQRPAGGRA